MKKALLPIILFSSIALGQQASREINSRAVKGFNNCMESLIVEDKLWAELRADYIKCVPGQCLSARRPELIEALLKEHDSRRKILAKLLDAEK